MNGEMASLLLPLLVLLPISGAVVTLFLPYGWRALAGCILSGLLLVGVFLLTVVVLQGDHPSQYASGWEAPLGIVLRADGLAVIFLLLTSLVGFPVGVYAAMYFRPQEEGKRATELFWPLWFFVWAAMNGIYLSGDLFNLYVLLEVLGLGAVSLAILSGKTAALVAGLRYLLAALAGSMAYLMGVALLYGAYGVLDMALLQENIIAGRTEAMAMVLLLLGLFLKTALFPFHFWLPAAHASAVPPVSAILSALVVKASFYIILRLWVDVFQGSVATVAVAQLLGGLGAVAIVWGSYQALRQNSLKRMVAHSTVSQIGYLFLLFPLISVGLREAEWLPHAWTGGAYQVLAHGLAKASMFLSVGVIVLAVGNDRKDSMLNMVGRLPMTTFALALAGISLIGLPPSGGFVAKWMFLKASLSSGQWWWVPMIVWGSFLTAGYVFMVLRMAFAPAPRKRVVRRVPRTLEVMALVLAGLAILIGFRAGEILLLLEGDGRWAEAIDSAGEGGVE